MDIRPEIELEMPDGLQGKELVKYLHQEYHGLLTTERLREIKTETVKKKEVLPKNACQSCGGMTSIGTDGVVEEVANGLHPSCRKTEYVYKKNNL